MGYELVAVARTPAASGAPTFVEVGPIVAPQITWTDELNGPGSIAWSATADRLPDDVKARFAAPDLRPTEVWLYRDGTLVAAGIVETAQVQGGTISATCPGLLHYLAYWFVVADLAYVTVDQFTIAAGLVDQWQSLSYGHFGIDTSSVGTSSVDRDRTYLAVERHQVLQRVLELGAVDDGFDTYVDPSTRQLVLTHPTRGSDLSASVVLDARNVGDDSLTLSVAPGDFASEAFGVGTGPDQTPITSTKSNTTVRDTWGRAGVTETFDLVSVQGTLDDHTQALLDARATVLAVPGPGIVPVADVDVDSFAAGDAVTYSFDSGLGLVTLPRRVRVKQVTVDETGNETIAVSFA